MDIAPDGSFTLTIGPQGSGRNHLKTAPGPMTFLARDVLADWGQAPVSLEIRRTGGPDLPPPGDEAALGRRLAAELPDFVRFWAAFTDRWLGGVADNEIVGPAARDGGWGYLAAGRFDLAEDEAIIVTTRDADARYSSVQVTNPWVVMPENVRDATLSFNNNQVAPNPDGSVTYVVSRRDPGVANWIDTGGLRQGFVVFRWEFVPPGADPKRMLTGYRRVKLADLSRELPAETPRLDAKGRAAQIAARPAAYDQRLGTPLP
jgi:hypothetical protein